MKLFALRKTSQGRQRGEFPLGSLFWDEGIKIDVRDRALRDSLREYFVQPIWVPLPLGDERILGHTWECLEPGDEEHFMEAARRLYRKDLYLDIKGEMD